MISTSMNNGTSVCASLALSTFCPSAQKLSLGTDSSGMLEEAPPAADEDVLESCEIC